MELFASQDPRSYSLYFNFNMWFRARKVTGTFEERAPGLFQEDLYGVIGAITLLISPHQFAATCRRLAAEHFSSFFILNMANQSKFSFLTSSLLFSVVCIDKRKFWLVAGIFFVVVNLFVLSLHIIGTLGSPRDYLHLRKFGREKEAFITLIISLF